MKPYIKLYRKTLGIHDTESAFSELSGGVANDIHHILCRGMGGNKTADRIENLMAVTREEHIKYGDKKQYIAYLFKKHKAHLVRKNIIFDEKWIDEQIEKWSVYEN